MHPQQKLGYNTSRKGSTNSRNGPDQIHTLFYGTDRTMNAEFKRMRQVCCHIGMESVTSARDGSAWVRLVDIKRRVIQVHEYS